VKSVLGQAIKKLGDGKRLTDREERVFNYLGAAFIWNAVFTDEQVAEDLFFVLRKSDLINEDDRVNFETNRSFLALYITTLMHGSAVLLDNGSRAELVAGFDNRQGQIEVKARLILNDTPKPIFAPVCVFWTGLQGNDHCSSTLIDDPKAWSDPIEIGADGKLTVFA
jgi:hypothetical protein